MLTVLDPVTTDDGARLHVVCDGPDDAPTTIVLAHGWTLTHRSWDAAVAILRHRRNDLRVVRYDHRDHGASTGPRVPARVERLALDLDAVVTAHGGPGRLVFGGHSMGAMAVLALAGLRPELVAQRVEGVLLAGASSGGLPGAPPLTAAMRVLSWLPATVPVPRVPAFAARRIGYGPGTPSATVTRARHGIAPTRARAVGSWFGALSSHDGSGSLRGLAGVPTTVLVGAHDRLTPPRHSATMAAALPGATLVILPGAGHMLPLERPDLVAGHLVDLSDEVRS